MDTKSKSQVRVGAFVAFALLLMMYVIFTLGKEESLFEQKYELKAHFSDVSGLRAGSLVQLAGFRVGYVGSIDFNKDVNNKNIEVTLKIEDGFQDRIRKDSVASLSTEGLLGDKFLFVTIGSQSEPPLIEGDSIATKEEGGLGDLTKKSGEIADNLKKLTESAEDVKAIMSSTRNIMKEVETGNGFMHSLVYDKKGAKALSDLSLSFSNLQEVTRKINSGQGTLGGLMSDPALYNRLRSIAGQPDRGELLQSIARTTLEENEKDLERE